MRGQFVQEQPVHQHGLLLAALIANTGLRIVRVSIFACAPRSRKSCNRFQILFINQNLAHLPLAVRKDDNMIIAFLPFGFSRQKASSHQEGRRVTNRFLRRCGQRSRTRRGARNHTAVRTWRGGQCSGTRGGTGTWHS